MATSIKLDAQETERLRALAALRKRSPHYLMREAIREYLAREEARDALHERVHAAWQQLRAAGTQPAADEAERLLETLALPPPDRRR